MIERQLFPDAYAELPAERLLRAFAAGPEQVRRSLTGLGPDELRARVVPGKWTIQEIVLHVTDSEVMGAARFRQTLAQSGREFAFYDQEVWARELGYQEQPVAAVEAALGLFTALRSTTTTLLARVDADGWQATGVHAELGEVTLRQLLELYADHSERHVAQILERREKLGRPADVPLLLPERLY